MGRRRLNLNNYILCSEEEATLEIVPLDIDGERQSTLYFKSTRPRKIIATSELVDSGEVEWTPTIDIDRGCSENEYKKLVEWWFDNATPEYKEVISMSFRRLPDITETIMNVRSWLLTEATYSKNSRNKFDKRKKNIGRFLKNWLTRELDRLARSR